MEKKGYREALEMLTMLYPGRMTLSVKEVATATDTSLVTVYEAIKRVKNPLPVQRFGRNKIIIPIPALARWMAG